MKNKKKIYKKFKSIINSITYRIKLICINNKIIKDLNNRIKSKELGLIEKLMLDTLLFNPNKKNIFFNGYFQYRSEIKEGAYIVYIKIWEKLVYKEQSFNFTYNPIFLNGINFYFDIINKTNKSNDELKKDIIDYINLKHR